MAKDYIETLTELMADPISPDAKLVEIKAKCSEIFEKTRATVIKYLGYRRELVLIENQLKAKEELMSAQLHKHNMSLPKNERYTTDAMKIRIKEAVRADKDCEGLYEKVSKARDYVQTLEAIVKHNKFTHDCVHDMQIAESSMLKTKQGA